jgi:hypothetical protein
LEASPGKKYTRHQLNGKKIWESWFMPDFPAMERSLKKDGLCPGKPSQKAKHYFKKKGGPPNN